MKPFDSLVKNDGQYTLGQVADLYGIVQTRAQFIPGRFYSLKIISPTPNLNEDSIFALSGKPYFDLNPCGLVLFHDNWKETALMLNLKVIPPVFLSRILESYYRFALQNGLASLFRGDRLIPLEERRLIDQRFYTVTPRQLGLNLNFAINKYNMDAVAEARLIDWEDFGMLVRPKFSQVGLFPEGLNMERIFETIIENLTS